MSLDYPGAALALARRGDYWPPERQAEFEQLIEAVTQAGDKLLPQLPMLWVVMPNYCHFLAYACDVFDHHYRIIAAFAARDWRGYVEAHPQFLRPIALDFAVNRGLSGELYWQLLTFVYIHDDCSDRNNRRLFYDLYSDHYNVENRIMPYRRALMNAAELEVYDALPDTVTIYRGTPSADEVEPEPGGMSWTLEYRVAEFYAGRYNGVIFTVQFPKEAIWAYYAAHGEAEVLIDSTKLKDCEYEVTFPFVGARKWTESDIPWAELSF